MAGEILSLRAVGPVGVDAGHAPVRSGDGIGDGSADGSGDAATPGDRGDRSSGDASDASGTGSAPGSCSVAGSRSTADVAPLLAVLLLGWRRRR